MILSRNISMLFQSIKEEKKNWIKFFLSIIPILVFLYSIVLIVISYFTQPIDFNNMNDFAAKLYFNNISTSILIGYFIISLFLCLIDFFHKQGSKVRKFLSTIFCGLGLIFGIIFLILKLADSGIISISDSLANLLLFHKAYTNQAMMIITSYAIGGVVFYILSLVSTLKIEKENVITLLLNSVFILLLLPILTFLLSNAIMLVIGIIVAIIVGPILAKTIGMTIVGSIESIGEYNQKEAEKREIARKYKN
ncbi:MAG: hypothetical protein IJ193_04105 [Bacilli bacterium]|nr:hypothetical protein [Bacilli bacterium]